MKIHSVEAGSVDWLKVRLGIPTASNFHKILTPAKLDFSKQARGYAFKLIAEKMMNESLDSIDYIDHVQRGKDLEPDAVKMFELVEDKETAPVGFITLDDMSAGATPDRLIVGEAAALECKCPSPWVHLEYLVDGFGADYIVQVQGQAYVGEFDYVSRWSYHPAFPPVLVKTYRDEMIIAKLRDGLNRFNDMKAEIEMKVRASGFIEQHPSLLTAWDELAASEDHG